MKPHQVACVVVLVASVGSSQGGGGLPAGAVRMSLGSEVFGPGKPPFPPTAQVAILEGDPAKAGQFTARIKIPAAFSLPPHTHPVTERTTVLSGSVYVGFGLVADRAHATKLSAGAFYLNPKGEPHFL